MPQIDTTIPVSASGVTSGQIVDFKGEFASSVVITNNSGASVQYSTNASSFTTLADGSTASLGAVEPSLFRIRKAALDAAPGYPLLVGLSWVYGDDEIRSEQSSGRGYTLNIGGQNNKVSIVCTWEQSLTTHLASSYPGHKAFITDVGEYGSDWISDGTDWNPLHQITLSSQTASSVSIGQKTDADALYGDLWTYTLPRGMLIKNRALELEPVFVYPNSATTKNLRALFGGATLYQKNRTTSALEAPLIQIIARGSATAQITPYATPSLYASASTGAVNTSTVNCAAAVTISVSAQWGTAGAGSNIISLESMRLRLIP